MLDKIIQFSIKNKFIILLFTLVLIAWGSYSIKNLPLDALPDVTNNQVQIITTAPTLASQEVEQLITYPLEQAVKTIPKVIELRSISRFGLSVVTVVFKDDVDIYWAREQIFQRLKQAEENIPKYAGSPELGPISTGLGEIYQYDVYAKKGYEDKYDAVKLRTIQDWIITPQLQGIEGVAEVSTWGGKLKQYEVAINPNKLNSLGITITDIFEALEKNNQNTGGAYIEKDQYSYFIRGVGMATGIKDLENIVVANKNGAPILIRNVAEVREGVALRYGASTKDGKGEIVCGMALMLKGENSSAVVNRVKEKMDQINKTLPEGVVAEAFIDRGKLVDSAIGTVTKNLLEGALIVIFVLILFLGNLRAGLIVASVIPLSMLFAVILMNTFGVSGNLMSLGAIDFGIIVDGAVIIVEATMHHLQKLKRKKDLSQSEMDEEVYQSASKIRNSAAFGEIIILIVYLPILALVGTEGKMFRPMAMTVGFAVIGAFVMSLTYVPMMSAMFLSKNTEHKTNFSDRMMAWFEGIYTPFLEKALRFKKAVLAISLGLFVLALVIFQNMGGEFIPTIEEGDLALNATIMTGSSLSQMVKTTTEYEKILKAKFPEIKTIVTKIGSGEIPTDPMPIESGDMIIVLKDKSEWTGDYDNWEDLANAMKEEMEAIPGANIEVSQPIQMRFNELMTGSRSDIAIKIFGDDLEILDTKAKELIAKVNNIEGIGDLKADKVTGLPQITVKYDYNKIALYGLNITDINQIIRSSFAGESAGKIYEESKRFDVVVRMDAASRTDITDVSNLFIPLPNGQQVPLSQVATVSYEQGPVQVSRENGKRRITVGLNVRGRDIKSVVEEIQAKLDKDFKLPPGYYVTYGGQFENLIEATKRLSVALPIALALIMVLLYFTFNSMKQSLLIFTAIPLSAIGGVFALWMRGMPFSISAGIGFIALFGIAVLNGIVLISYFNQLKSEGITDPLQRVLMGTKTRLRPVLMTAAVASLGFMPMALSTSGGAEVQKPLATVVIGGLLSATLLTLIVLPILYLLFEKGIKARRKIKTPIVTLIVLLISSFSFAQNSQPISLQKAIEIAKTNNIDLKIADKEIEKQTVLKKTAFQADPLQVQYQGGQFNSKYYDSNVSIQQYFPIGRITKANRQLQEELVKLAEKRKALSEYEIEKAVTIAYYQYLYGVSVQKLNADLLEIYSKFLKNAELRFETGESGKIEVISAKAKSKEIETQQAQLEFDLAIYQKQLQFFIQTEENIVPDSTTPMQYSFQPNENQSKVETLVTDYYTQQISVYQKEANTFKALRTPKLGLGYFGQTIDTKSYFQGFTAGLQIPLFGGVNSAKAKASAISISQSQLELDKNKLTLKLQMQELKNDFEKQQKALDYYQKEGLLYAEQIIATAQKSYANGDMSYWYYISFLNQAIDIKKQNAEATNAYNQSAIQLQFPSISNK
ncbi:CusA/CzcA family heavy metal efflux RND transporter [Flavobacterium sp. SOK18b]|jgi:cobalt-zinc-cadmium resistance protein CzcA|uniref:CusA/CzcA family heavy metal efflux RND transporter n=3 Tax=Flavobacterium TaxID=237 RepID=A0A4R5AP95_9FLAO|nr:MULTISPECIES: CusA/CzcA family heavy metal efflux RND transporter [Flavobacterium]MBB1193459.1 CusA/CzcA family heavy metal efflux RND transporter [Flavobacterium sp. SOK18b]MBC5864303.1 CusA/CzcA family heavy metal efflux RND transporter [Flavobacterium turcicum]NHL02923.1 CusA/CzcA family heavy metal efflux RND transporter [Flavobacterium turcicum]OUD34819.1 heat-shock protein Hsp70 [Flavobacterium sp. FPG59]RBN50556.1 CusA/CzcA family heavy metal efflux RND transporter [Flavobacterium ps